MEIAILLALIVLNGVFAMSEIALVTARKARMQKLIDEGHLSASVTTGSAGLSDVNLSVSPAGDGQVTQQITLKGVDLSGWNLSGSSSHDILQSMLDQHSLIIQHP